MDKNILNKTEYISENSLAKNLDTAFMGSNLIVLDSTDSTNNYLKNIARNGAKNGTVVIAREQTSGKGRLGRVWSSEKDKNLTFSILLRPDIKPDEVQAITPVAGLALCKAIREFFNLDCKIKWPNDVIIGKKKLSGILTEMSAIATGVDFIVIGIGINLDQENFDDEIKHKATSIYLETNEKTDKNAFLASILKHIEDEFVKCNYHFTAKNIAEYKSLCATIGRQVSFLSNNKTLTGTAVDINPNGELVVQLPDKNIYTINSGEVTIQGIY